IVDYIRPKGPQIEALYELKKTRLEGLEKGLIVAATGVGKTFLAAFDSKSYNKILFLAHREEILNQAARSFSLIKPDAKIGFFTGARKDQECDILFATVQTLGRIEYLNDQFFSKEYFGYIIIDEFHHAVSNNYGNVIEYFKPEFLLGLTATPERLDNQDVFALCDYNLVYEARLKEAINKGWLVPFRYYGVFDDTNYSSVDYRNGKYNEKQLERILSRNERADLILKNYLKYKSLRSLGFCSSRNHAVYMAEYFSNHGVSSCAVISGNGVQTENESESKNKSFIIDRKEAIYKLKKAEINVIFSVDMFNEGLDIPEIDLVMFLRPTESPTVFLQQLGRGLRKQRNKNYLNVLDFIGNYKKANLIPYFLTGDIKDYQKLGTKGYIPDEEEYPEGCFINFDLRTIDLFRHLSKEQQGLFERVTSEYMRIKESREDKPMRLSMYTYMDERLYSAIISRKNMNIFRDYLSFLEKINELNEDEENLIGTKAHEFIKEIENAKMSKLYKMPILLAFYNNGNIKLVINNEDIYRSFKEFYSRGSNAVDMLRDSSTSNYKEWGKEEYISLAKRNPLKFLKQSSSNFFYEQDDKFCLTPALQQYIDNEVFIR
ncbi:MAG: DEAD/DEAH box helicase, partial [Bacteroidales bacterium]|nr:DEAD/DEAH box helicase [Bacteroidales bacterium]